jgi:hypothetical protein
MPTLACMAARRPLRTRPEQPMPGLETPKFRGNTTTSTGNEAKQDEIEMIHRSGPPR